MRPKRRRSSTNQLQTVRLAQHEYESQGPPSKWLALSWHCSVLCSPPAPAGHGPGRRRAQHVVEIPVAVRERVNLKLVARALLANVVTPDPTSAAWSTNANVYSESPAARIASKNEVLIDATTPFAITPHCCFAGRASVEQGPRSRSRWTTCRRLRQPASRAEEQCDPVAAIALRRRHKGAPFARAQGS
jgi:hypothetical protein